MEPGPRCRYREKYHQNWFIFLLFWFVLWFCNRRKSHDAVAASMCVCVCTDNTTHLWLFQTQNLIIITILFVIKTLCVTHTLSSHYNRKSIFIDASCAHTHRDRLIFASSVSWLYVDIQIFCCFQSIYAHSHTRKRFHKSYSLTLLFLSTQHSFSSTNLVFIWSRLLKIKIKIKYLRNRKRRRSKTTQKKSNLLFQCPAIP